VGLRLVFLGTPEFAVPSLEKTVEAGHEVVSVFTQPDRPKGRGRKEAMSPVKAAALRLGIEVHQPERVRRPVVVAQIAEMRPEAMVVVGYGQIIPQSILDIPPLGIINVHASLLPKYRGAAPIQWAIARGELRTGVTTMRINAGLDTGDMLLRWETAIELEENAVALGSRLSVAGSDLLVRTLAELGSIIPEPQDDSAATLAPILKRDDGHVDWGMTAREILNRVRGFQPWPGAYGFLRGGRFQVWRAMTGRGPVLPAGQIEVRDRSMFVGCGDGAIELIEVQMEGKKRMDVAAFLNGNTIEKGERLG
jgi:methionyl-tRNA formyltransferase